MWTKGNINGYEYTAKVFDAASDMGINKGRISKLDMTKGGKLVASYDRGWDMKPTTADEKAAVKELLRRFK